MPEFESRLYGNHEALMGYVILNSCLYDYLGQPFSRELDCNIGTGNNSDIVLTLRFEGIDGKSLETVVKEMTDIALSLKSSEPPIGEVNLVYRDGEYVVEALLRAIY